MRTFSAALIILALVGIGHAQQRPLSHRQLEASIIKTARKQSPGIGRWQASVFEGQGGLLRFSATKMKRAGYPVFGHQGRYNGIEVTGKIDTQTGKTQVNSVGPTSGVF